MLSIGTDRARRGGHDLDGDLAGIAVTEAARICSRAAFEKGLFPTLLEAYFNEGLDVPRAATFWTEALGYVPRDDIEVSWAIGRACRSRRQLRRRSGLYRPELVLECRAPGEQVPVRVGAADQRHAYR